MPVWFFVVTLPFLALLMLGAYHSFQTPKVIKRLKAQDSPFVPYTQPTDPYDLAYLRAGCLGVVQQAFLGLVAKGYLTPTGRRGYGGFVVEPWRGAAELSDEEQALLSHYVDAWRKFSIGSKIIYFPQVSYKYSMYLPQVYIPQAPMGALESQLRRREQGLEAQQLILNSAERATVARLIKIQRVKIIYFSAWGIGGFGFIALPLAQLVVQALIARQALPAILGGLSVTAIIVLLIANFVLAGQVPHAINSVGAPSTAEAPTTKKGQEALANAQASLRSSAKPGLGWEFDSLWLAAFGRAEIGPTVLSGVDWALELPPSGERS